MKVVTRFAPSPTGFLHIGGVRTALYGYLLARKYDGTFILRIEDTDKTREVEGSIEHIQESLTWVRLLWDYGPDIPGPWGSNIQSERLMSYKKYAQKLADAGYAYQDPYTEAEVEQFRNEAKLANVPFLYRNYRPQMTPPWDGVSTLRFRVPEVKRYTWTDAVRGELEAGEEALDDFVLMKADGYPTYNFAHIIDDLEMGVTHIIRGDEFISSTPRFLSLYEALNIKHPVFVTVPPILKDDRTKKLGKRDGAKDILDYRDEGYLPEAMTNYLALLGWNPGTDQELFTLDELVRVFEIERIHKAGAAFNEVKLNWINREHMLRMEPEAFWEHAEEFLSVETVANLDAKNMWRAVVPVMRERISTFGELREADLRGEYQLFYTAPAVDPQALVPKAESIEATKPRLEHVLGLLEGISDPWTAESVKAAIWDYADTEGRGKVLWPMRMALSGRDKSPDPFTISAIIGRDETCTRIRAAVLSLSV